MGTLHQNLLLAAGFVNLHCWELLSTSNGPGSAGSSPDCFGEFGFHDADQQAGADLS